MKKKLTTDDLATDGDKDALEDLPVVKGDSEVRGGFVPTATPAPKTTS